MSVNSVLSIRELLSIVYYVLLATHKFCFPFSWSGQSSDPFLEKLYTCLSCDLGKSSKSYFHQNCGLLSSNLHSHLKFYIFYCVTNFFSLPVLLWKKTKKSSILCTLIRKNIARSQQFILSQLLSQLKSILIFFKIVPNWLPRFFQIIRSCRMRCVCVQREGSNILDFGFEHIGPKYGFWCERTVDDKLGPWSLSAERSILFNRSEAKNYKRRHTERQHEN